MLRENHNNKKNQCVSTTQQAASLISKALATAVINIWQHAIVRTEGNQKTPT